MNHKQRVIDYYDATHIDYRALWTGNDNPAVHFGYYDKRSTNHKRAIMRMNEILAESVQVKASDTVLDAGCGYGGSSMWLARTYGCHATGVTLSPLQTTKAREYIQERHLAGSVEVVEGDYAHLIFKDGSFDIYWALESLVHAEDRKRVIAEMYRVLKRGGRTVIAEYTLRNDPPLGDAEKKYIEPWLQGWAMPRLLTPEEHIEGLAQAGFKDIQVRDITAHVSPSLRRLEILCILHYPIALLIAPFFFRKERSANYHASWRQIRALKKGLWRYSIITAHKE